jgi:uncharacterized membrane protein
MNNTKIRNYLISGIFLIFIGLKDIDNFSIFYEGIALGLGLTALVLALIEYMKKFDKDEQ